MKTFVINLDKNPDRLASMKRQLDAFGIEFDRFPAVYGKNLTKAELRRDYNRFRSILVNGKSMQLGEIGCALSHLGVYRRVVDDDIPFALILEDDVALEESFPSVLSRIELFVHPDRKQIVLLSGHELSESAQKVESGIVKIRGGLCADAYIVTNAAAKALISANYPVIAPADKWIRFQKTAQISMYRFFPTVARQDKAAFPNSNIIQEHVEYKGVAFVLWKAARVIETVVDRVLTCFTKR